MSTPSAALVRLASEARLEQISMATLSAERFMDQQDFREDAEPPRFAMRNERLEDADSAFMRVFLRCDVPLPEGDVVVEPFAVYSIPGTSVDLFDDEETVIGFINEVAVMAMLPYVRQGVADMSQRVFEAAVLMPAFPRGAISFNLKDAIPQSEDSSPVSE